MLDPYVVAGCVIAFAALVCIVTFKYIYDNRTQSPDIGSMAADKFGLDLPDGVDLNDALGGVFKR